MRQYCRYCSHLFYMDVPYCEVREACINEHTAKSPNHCRNFEFNEIDAFAGIMEDGKFRTYKPRPERGPDPVKENQISLWEETT